VTHPEPIFIVTDIMIPDELCFIIYWDKDRNNWFYEHPRDREEASVTNVPPYEWVKFGWTLEMNFCELPAYPCSGCDTPVHYDYLCPSCRLTNEA
jgi:hypothetical protein